jgi:hypothetical protein
MLRNLAYKSFWIITENFKKIHYKQESNKLFEGRALVTLFMMPAIR